MYTLMHKLKEEMRTQWNTTLLDI